jgi:hypothetical protein
MRAVSPAPIMSSGTQNALTTTQGGATGFIPMVLYSNTSTASTSGTTASPWTTTGVGSLTIPANYMVPGKVLHIRAGALLTTAATPGTVTMTVTLGATNVWAGVANTPTASITSICDLDVYATCLTAGAGGTLGISAKLVFTTVDGSATLLFDFTVSGGKAFNTTVANTLAVTSTNSVASGAVFTVPNFFVEALA